MSCRNIYSYIWNKGRKYSEATVLSGKEITLFNSNLMSAIEEVLAHPPSSHMKSTMHLMNASIEFRRIGNVRKILAGYYGAVEGDAIRILLVLQ